MTRTTRYSQFCPVAKAAEVIAERWTPLIVRELLLGNTRFNGIRRGVPGISPALLSQRLRELQRAGVVQKVQRDGSSNHELTESGRELWPVIEAIGNWGKKWTGDRFRRDELDAGVLMLDMSRRVNRQALPTDRTLVHFEFTGAPPRQGDYWLLLDSAAPPSNGDCDDACCADVCFQDPGFEVQLHVRAALRAMVAIWMGDLSWETAIRQRSVELEGPIELRRQFPGWFKRSLFSGTQRAVG
jgi:DNA-binding HxlR family transcriptional regulator